MLPAVLMLQVAQLIIMGATIPAKDAIVLRKHF